MKNNRRKIDKLKFMIRKAIFMMALCVCGQLHANAETMDDGTDDLVPSGINEDMLLKVYQHILESQMKAAVEAPEALAA